MIEQTIASRELEVYIENTSEVYTKFTLPVVKNLVKHYKKGVYTKEKALISWNRLVLKAAKSYNMEYCFKDGDWKEMFKKEDLKQTAEILESNYFEEIKLGNY